MIASYTAIGLAALLVAALMLQHRKHKQSIESLEGRIKSTKTMSAFRANQLHKCFHIVMGAVYRRWIEKSSGKAPKPEEEFWFMGEMTGGDWSASGVWRFGFFDFNFLGSEERNCKGGELTLTAYYVHFQGSTSLHFEQLVIKDMAQLVQNQPGFWLMNDLKVPGLEEFLNVIQELKTEKRLIEPKKARSMVSEHNASFPVREQIERERTREVLLPHLRPQASQTNQPCPCNLTPKRAPAPLGVLFILSY